MAFTTIVINVLRQASPGLYEEAAKISISLFSEVSGFGVSYSGKP